MRHLLFFCALFLSIAWSQAAQACGSLDDACQVEMGSYHVALPDGWDGDAPLGLLLFFHGYGSSGASPLKNPALLEEASQRNLLLVAPNGLPSRPGGRTSWAHVGSPSQARDELPFIDQVLADVEARWPLDPDRRYVSGFSQGGSMAWDVACYRGEAFTGFAPIAGAFWNPLPPDCPSGAVALRHVHGTDDTVVPMKGRPIGPWHQGDVLKAMTIRRAVNHCAAEPDRVVEEGRLTCQVWNACDGGAPVALCLHPGGHSIRAEWVGAGIDWIEGR